MRVLLDGTGLDESFGGYRVHQLHYLCKLREKNINLYANKAAEFCKVWKTSVKNLNRSIHIGIFCFEFKTVLRITGFKKSFLEQNENIELIRCLENNINVFSYDVKNELIGVDTMKEFKKVKFILENNKRYLNQINKFYTLT